MTPERAASRLATHRVVFVGHALLYAAVELLLLSTAGLTAAWIVAVAWGALLGTHGYVVVVAPGLRRALMRQELAQLGPAATGDAQPPAPLPERARQARALEELSAAIAHEIRNPITAAKSLVQQMTDDPAGGEHAEYGRIAVEELDRVERAISHLLRFARDEAVEMEETDLGSVVKAALELLAERVEKSGATIEREVDDGLALRADPGALRRVVANLVGNALDAIETTSAPRIRIAAGHSLDGKTVWLRVADNGPGIDEARAARIWSPFFTTKESGTGLGLAIAKKIVEAHGGTIELSKGRAVGAELVLAFPISAAHARAPRDKP